MDEEKDLLEVKIEKAKSLLSPETLSAINAVPWQAHILKMRETKGYSFEQLGSLEIETELLLCGLLSPENYAKELENRMRLKKTEVDGLIEEMNVQVFSKIKEELVKILERRAKESQAPAAAPAETKAPGLPAVLEEHESDVLSGAGIKILDAQPSPEGNTGPSFLEQKLTSAVKTGVEATDHSKEAASKPAAPAPYAKGNDPYRLPPI